MKKKEKEEGLKKIGNYSKSGNLGNISLMIVHVEQCIECAAKNESR